MQKKIILLIFLDQITKLIFSTRDFFVGPIHIHSTKNFGLSFTLDFGLVTNLVLVVLGLLFFIYYFLKHRENISRWEQMGYVLIFAGAISNILDRVFLGFVRDFLDVSLGFTFNLADVFILVGLLLLFFHNDGDKSEK